jgi:hypothetical protein
MPRRAMAGSGKSELLNVREKRGARIVNIVIPAHFGN